MSKHTRTVISFTPEQGYTMKHDDEAAYCEGGCAYQHYNEGHCTKFDEPCPFANDNAPITTPPTTSP